MTRHRVVITRLCSFYFVTHDGSRFGTSRTLAESSLTKSRGEAVPRKGVGHLVLFWFDGVAFEDFSAALPNVFDGGLEQLNRNPLTAEWLGYKQTGHGPDRLVIDPFQNARALQGRIRFPWRHGTPPNRCVSTVG